MYNQYLFGFLLNEEETYYIVKQFLKTGKKIENLLIRYLKRKTQIYKKKINLRVKTHFLQIVILKKRKLPQYT